MPLELLCDFCGNIVQMLPKCADIGHLAAAPTSMQRVDDERGEEF